MRSAAWILLGASLLQAQVLVPADRPVPRTDSNSQRAHQQLLEKARSGRIDLYFEGDSITRRWGATDYPELLAHWRATFHGWNAANFGWGADRVENILWRLENGELDGVHPKVIVLLAGTNNASDAPTSAEGVEAAVANLTKGLETVIGVMQKKAPGAVIIAMGIFPRNDKPAAMPVIRAVNRNLERLAHRRSVRFLDLTPSLTEADGTLRDGMMGADRLHPTRKAYEVWAEALKPLLTELLGPPQPEDHAPPPTGNPAATSAVQSAPNVDDH